MRIAALTIVLAGCSMPQYASRPVAFTAAPTTPFEQARAICAPRAQLAATQARNTAAPVPSGYAAAVNSQNAYAEAGNAVFSGCLAEYGWRLERSCIQNCR